MDKITREQRSYNMSQIKGKNTKIECAVRRALFKDGYRFKVNVKTLPGKPDIVLPKYHTVIFINGCFWHRHDGCKYATTPKTRTEFWESKFRKNVINDIKYKIMLEDRGWNVITLWECDINQSLEKVINSLKEELGNLDVYENAKIKDINTLNEIKKRLRKRNISYSINNCNIEGNPDLVIKGNKIAVFIDSDFFCGRLKNDEFMETIRYKDYWINIINENESRNMEIDKRLNELGWKSIRFWNSDIKKNADRCAELIHIIKNGNKKIDIIKINSNIGEKQSFI